LNNANSCGPLYATEHLIPPFLCVGEQDDPWSSKVASIEGKEHQNDTWASKMTSGAEDNTGGWNTRAKDSCTDGGEERRNDPWANKTVTIKGTQGINYTVFIGHSA